MEDHRFRSFFGSRQDIVEMVWDMLGEGGLRPEKSKPKHLLWALYLLKVYPREGPGCSAVGGSKGAINPRKWVWLFLECITELAENVVSYLFRCDLPGHCLIQLHCPSLSPKPQIMFKSRLEHDVGNNCLMTIDGTDFHIQQKGAARKGNLFAFHKYAGKSALCYELGVDILTGNLEWIEGPYPTGAWNNIKKLTVFYPTAWSRVSALRPTMATWGKLIRLSAPTMTATQWRTLGCRERQGLATRCLTGTLKIGASWRRCTSTTSRCTGRFFTRVR
jgi:hypothetical protein